MFRQILLLMTVALVVSACEVENTDRLKEDLSLHFFNETEESFEVKLYAGQGPSLGKDFNKSDSLFLDIASKDEVSAVWNPKVNEGEGGFLLRLTDQRYRTFGYYTRRSIFDYTNFEIVIKADTIEISQSK